MTHTEAVKILMLGTKSVTADNINDAWRNLIKVVHPDVPETGDSEKFKQAQIAKQFLLSFPSSAQVPTLGEVKMLIKSAQQKLKNIEATTQLWGKDDPRVPAMKNPIVQELEELEKLAESMA
jgi:hypothetical protein